jgi:hypothetical protein
MTELAIRPQAAADRLTKEQVAGIANTEIVPKHLRGKQGAIIATILKGRALGLDDIHSLTAIHFIEGKAALSAETMVALVRRRGHSITWNAKPGESCTVYGTRTDTGDKGEVTWTMGMATDAGLKGKDNWKRYPDAMLFARAVSQLCRQLFADVLVGASYTPDEAEEVAERGRVTEAVSDLPAVEEQKTRDEPAAALTDAQINRIAALEERLGGPQMVTLRGVFGVETALELDPAAAEKYEAILESALLAAPEDSAEGPRGDSPQPATDGEGASPQLPLSDDAAGAVDEPGQSVTEGDSPSAELPGEPGPDDEVVEGEVVEDTQSDLVELAGSTIIPNGNYKGTALRDIHDSWIEYALTPTGLSHLPGPFAEALEMWAQERKPELWTKVRG